MSKKPFKSQASSARAGGFGAFSSAGGFGSTASSTLSYVQEAPDYSGINDANVVVAFKNLTKKDATTKAKALEDLGAHTASSNVDIEDGLLEAWVRLFPRLSIDNARRVRQLAHSVNGAICLSCGKRTVKSLPRIAGAWLAGTYDSDKTSAKAAQDALSLVFPSPQKIQGFRKAFNGPILEYCRDALLKETVQTLSDERSVTKDDAEATYARVVSTSLAVVASILHESTADEITKQQQIFDELFAASSLWSLAYHSDVAVRKAMHILIRTATKRQPTGVETNLTMVSTAYVYKALPSDQTGSATDLVQTLDALTAAFPTIWTQAFTGKKAASSRLRQLLKHGSQGGTTTFWDGLTRLLPTIPSEIWPATHDDARELVIALRDGVQRRDERFNTSSAWITYYTLLDTVCAALPEEDATRLAEGCAMPIIHQYLLPSPDTADWSISGGKASALVAGAAVVKRTSVAVQRDWPVLVNKLAEEARLSQPEQAKDFEKSQTHVAAIGERWADLHRELFKRRSKLSTETIEGILAENSRLVKELISIFKSRDGKPYGATAIIAALLRACKTELLAEVSIKDDLLKFVREDIKAWLDTPSRRHLLRIAYAFESDPAFAEIFGQMLEHVLDTSATQRLSAIRDIFTQSAPEKVVESAQASARFQEFVRDLAQANASEDEAALLSTLIGAGVASQQTTDEALSYLISSLAIGESAGSGLSKLAQITKNNGSIVRAFMEKPSQASEQFLPTLLQLETSVDDKIAEQAMSLSNMLSSAIGTTTSSTKFSVVLQNLERVNQRSMTVDALHELTKRLVGNNSEIPDFMDILPPFEIWYASLVAAIRPPVQSLAILSPLGGAVHLTSSATAAPQKVQLDSEGISQALRIAIFVVRLMTETGLLVSMATDVKAKTTVMALLYLTTLLAEDNLSVSGANALWDPRRALDVEPLVLEFTGEASAIFSRYWQTLQPGVPGHAPSDSEYTLLCHALEHLVNSSEGNSAVAYYTALFSARTNTNLFEVHGTQAGQAKASEDFLRTTRAAKNTVSTASVLVGLQAPLSGTNSLNRFCNELVADLTDLSSGDSEQEQKGLEQLVLLNNILTTYEDAIDNIAKQRLIFLVKKLIPSLNTGSTTAITVEICKSLTNLLPGMKDMYGEHWAQVIAYLIGFWETIENQPAENIADEGQILLTHATLRLYGTLQKLARVEEPNDDLVEALGEERSRIADSLVQLLLAEGGTSDNGHQPLMVTHDLLARQLTVLDPAKISDISSLYSVVASPSRSVSQAAFELLHRQVPIAQEQVSLDAALDDKKAELPDELLSLLLDAPTLDSLVDAVFDHRMPAALQSYLYSWRLFFDHFNGSSHRVKNDYIDSIKETGDMSRLLNFTFDFLGHSRGRPVDASKFDIEQYTADTEPSAERDVQWLLVHLYYLALTHIPTLVKSYYLDIRSRQTSLAVETWTAKYISPRVIESSLDAVEKWARKSVQEDPENEAMTVRVGKRSKEINVSYEVDEQTMAIKIDLPEAYPLASAKVLGVSRVAVREEKWQSWIRNCQGVIIFSNGSITDGLAAWRKNVTGTLKGQTECAICYSIISGDKQLPTKKCPTCKHLFHTSCLFKWFKTSNASTCPLCRNPFIFS